GKALKSSDPKYAVFVVLSNQNKCFGNSIYGNVKALPETWQSISHETVKIRLFQNVLEAPGSFTLLHTQVRKIKLKMKIEIGYILLPLITVALFMNIFGNANVECAEDQGSISESRKRDEGTIHKRSPQPLNFSPTKTDPRKRKRDTIISEHKRSVELDKRLLDPLNLVPLKTDPRRRSIKRKRSLVF
ncbi:4319_t:CDS:2, partial [Acaulospora morrowiae]